MTAYTLFSQAATGTTIASDNANYTMGVQFTVSVSGSTLTAIWFYSASGASAIPQTIGLYQVTGAGTGTLVHSESASWSGAAGTGWIRAAFSSPPALTASTNYKACVFCNPAGVLPGFYSATSAYWSSGPGASGITNGPLSAPNNAGADVGQDSYDAANIAIAYPASTFGSANYWVDPEVTTPAAAPATQVASPEAGSISGWIMLPSRGRVASAG